MKLSVIPGNDIKKINNPCCAERYIISGKLVLRDLYEFSFILSENFRGNNSSGI